MNFLKSFIITCTPVILGGIFNMIFTKTKFFKNHAKPIDMGRYFVDGKPIFGKNKTYLGFVSMVIFTAIAQILWGKLVVNIQCEEFGIFYAEYQNSLLNNLWIGALLGFSYMIFELPNSFIKRRLDIEEGKTKIEGVGKFFFVFDQIDSLLGIVIVMCLLTNQSLLTLMGFVLVGGIVHISINYTLYKMNIRKNI